MAADFDAARLAAAYRRLVLWFGAQILLAFALPLRTLGGTGAGATLVAVVSTLAGWAILLALAYYAYRTSQALGSSVPWLWAVAMVVPIVNIVTLLVLSAQATRACRKHRVPVGLFGPKIQTEAESHRSEP